MTLRSATRLLLGLALGLPLVQAVLFWVAGLLSAMGDAAGATAISRANTVVAVVWLTIIVGLVVVLAARSLDEQRGP